MNVTKGEDMSYWVVVVDDDITTLKTIERILTENGMRVTALRSGKAMHEFLGHHDAPDLILLDIVMPEMDGFEAYRHLREKEAEMSLANLPVVFMTAEDEEDHETESLKLGVSDYIRKPFPPDVLVERVRNVIKANKKMLKFREEAMTDKLTGMLNKISTNERMAGLCSTKTGCLMMVDLDTYKMVNDIYGHDMGDEVLVAFAGILKRNTNVGSESGRIGGDEFMIFSADMKRETDVKAFTENINRELISAAKALMGEDMVVPLGASVGAVFVPEHGRDFEALYKYVDKALYDSKINGKHGYTIFHGYDMADYDSNARLSLGKLSTAWEERTPTQGAMWPNKDIFQAIYHYIMRFIRQNEISAFRMLITAQYTDEEAEKFRRTDVVESLGEMLRGILRSSDIMIQVGADTYYVLLMAVSSEQTDAICDRIRNEWSRTAGAEVSELVFDMERVETDDNR